MHIEKLKYFIDLYECRNYIETARKNFISQASISQYISSLEKEFNTKFFDRNLQLFSDVFLLFQANSGIAAFFIIKKNILHLFF